MLERLYYTPKKIYWTIPIAICKYGPKKENINILTILHLFDISLHSRLLCVFQVFQNQKTVIWNWEVIQFSSQYIKIVLIFQIII